MQIPVLGATVIYAGAMVAMVAGGHAVPGYADPGLRVLGRAEAQAGDVDAADGDESVTVKRRGTFLWDNSDGADRIAIADVNRTCYLVDDHTVAKTDGAGARSPAGVVAGVEDAGVWVTLGAAPEPARRLTLLHSPGVMPAVERMAPVLGQIRGTVVLDIVNISGFTAISDGTLTIGATMIDGIDLSAATTINDVVNAISAAVQLALPTYTVSLDYINPNFYGSIRRSDGDVPAIGGTLEPLFGFEPPAARTDHEMQSPNIVLPGSWSHLQMRFTGQSYTNQQWYCQSDFWRAGGHRLCRNIWRLTTAAAGARAISPIRTAAP